MFPFSLRICFPSSSTSSHNENLTKLVKKHLQRDVPWRQLFWKPQERLSHGELVRQIFENPITVWYIPAFAIFQLSRKKMFYEVQSPILLFNSPLLKCFKAESWCRSVIVESRYWKEKFGILSPFNFKGHYLLLSVIILQQLPEIFLQLKFFTLVTLFNSSLCFFSVFLFFQCFTYGAWRPNEHRCEIGERSFERIVF